MAPGGPACFGTCWAHSQNAASSLPDITGHAQEWKRVSLPAVIALYLAHKEFYEFFPVGWNETHLIVRQSPT